MVSHYFHFYCLSLYVFPVTDIHFYKVFKNTDFNLSECQHWLVDIYQLDSICVHPYSQKLHRHSRYLASLCFMFCTDTQYPQQLSSRCSVDSVPTKSIFNQYHSPENEISVSFIQQIKIEGNFDYVFPRLLKVLQMYIENTRCFNCDSLLYIRVCYLSSFICQNWQIQ